MARSLLAADILDFSLVNRVNDSPPQRFSVTAALRFLAAEKAALDHGLEVVAGTLVIHTIGAPANMTAITPAVVQLHHRRVQRGRRRRIDLLRLRRPAKFHPRN